MAICAKFAMFCFILSLPTERKHLFVGNLFIVGFINNTITKNMCESVLNAIMEGNPHVAVTITAKDLSQVVVSLFDRIEAAKEREAERAREIPTMSRDEVANTLNVSYSTLWRWQNEGILNPVKIGAKSLYRRSDIDAMLQKGAVAK